MADHDEPSNRKYDWLYSGQDGSSQGFDADPEETQQVRRPGADPPARPEGIEHTQVMGAGARTGDPLRAQERPSSFGGTYAAPQRDTSQAPQFATPVQPGAPRTSTGTPPSKPPQTGRRRIWWKRGILALIVVWILFLVLVPIWAWSRISKVQAEPSGERPAESGGTTYLLVGSDSREGLTTEQKGDLGTGSAAGQRTDTILLLHVPGGSGPNLLLSIPRDSYVDIPANGQNKINAAYAFGGPELLVQTVEQNTGIRVDDYIEVGFSGFVDIVDSVGGIDVCPKTAISDPKAGNLQMDKGCQQIDGHTALGYSRSRAFPLGDITRTEHQREVITQVGRKAASWQTVLLPWRYFSVNKAGSESIAIGDNVGPIDLAKFAWAMSHSGDSLRCVVPFRDLGASTPVGSAVVWDEQRAEDLFALVREDNTAAIECSNGELP